MMPKFAYYLLIKLSLSYLYLNELRQNVTIYCYCKYTQIFLYCILFMSTLGYVGGQQAGFLYVAVALGGLCQRLVGGVLLI